MEITKEFNLAVGLRIRETREGLKMTREQFSEMCGISASFLASIESGAKAITSKTLYKICMAANISPDYLILGREEGYEADIVLEMIRTLDSDSKGHAVRILKEYIEAVSDAKR